MHPLAIAGIVLGGVFLCWGGYEAIQTIYEWHNDRKEEREYKEYVRMHAEKGRFSGVPMFEEGDDSDPEDNEPLGHWQQKRASINSQSELRQRNISSSHAEKPRKSSASSSSYEFYEMERSISERKDFLERENRILQQEEAELERRRSILQSRGNSITGVFYDDSDNDQHNNPFAAHSFIEQQQELSNKQQDSSHIGSIFDQDVGKNPFSDSFSSLPREDSHVYSNESSLDKLNDDDVQQQQHQPKASSTSANSEASWSDLNEDILEEEEREASLSKNKKTDSDESFQHIEKH